MSSTTKSIILVCKIVFGLCALNFAAFMLGAAYLGGDALKGGIRDGRYLLMSHGTYTAVSREVFEYSRLHALSIEVTHPLAFAAGALVMYLQHRALLKP
jgi:hypothetical protein